MMRKVDGVDAEAGGDMVAEVGGMGSAEEGGMGDGDWSMLFYYVFFLIFLLSISLLLNSLHSAGVLCSVGR